MFLTFCERQKLWSEQRLVRAQFRYHRDRSFSIGNRGVVGDLHRADHPLTSFPPAGEPGEFSRFARNKFRESSRSQSGIEVRCY